MGSEDEGRKVDVFYLDFRKSFHTVSHDLLVARLKGLWAQWLNRKFADKLTGFSKFVDYSKLQQIGGIIYNLEDRAAIQRLARKKLCKQRPAGPGGQ